MAKSRGAAAALLALLVAGGEAAAQLPGLQTIPRRRTAVTVDGDLAEWADAKPYLVDRQEQVWSHGPDSPWGGPDDLSAEIYVAYDPAHLYLAGRVRDQSLVPGGVGRQWHQADAIEVFLDFGDPTAPAGGERREFDEDVVQLFFMPFSEDRTWGEVDWTVDPPLPTGIGLNGVEVAFEPLPDGRYAFEAVVPFHNYPQIRGQTRIGFGLALDDYDAGTDRYQYMTLDGLNPTVESIGRLARVGFEGPPPLETGPDDAGGPAPWLVQNAPYLLVPLVVILVLAGLTWGFGALGRRLPAFRPIGRAVGVGLFLLGLVLPGWLIDAREHDVQVELTATVGHLQQVVAKMEASVLGDVRGGERDRTLVDLLAGRTIVREQKFRYTFHPELVRARRVVGVGTQPFSGLGFRVRPYGIPLALGQEERFTFGEPLAPGTLNVVIARPASEVNPFIGPESTRITFTSYPVDSAPTTETIEFFGPFEPPPGAEFERLELSFESREIGAPVGALSLSAPEGSDVVLIGLTWVSDDRQEEIPLFLGVDSLGGVPTDLRGRWPATAGIELLPGTSTSFEIPPAQRFDKAWVFYGATYRGRTDTTVGETVAELRLGFSEQGVEPAVVAFDHQTTMFFEDVRYNQELPEGGEVEVAYRWEGDDGEARVSLMREIDVPAGATLASLTFENQGPFPIRFRSLVFGTKVESIETSLPDSPVVRAGEPAQWKLREQTLRRVGDAQVAIYRNGRLSDATFSDAESQARASLPIDGQPATLEQAAYRSPLVDGGATRAYEGYTNLPGDGWSGAVLGVFLRDEGYGAFVEWVHRLGMLLCLGAVPVLLLVFSEALAFLNNLRLRLVSVMTVATLVPLIVLSLVLIRVLEGGHEIEQTDDVRQAVATVEGRIQEEMDELQAAARSWLDDLVAELRAKENGGAQDFSRSLSPIMLNQMPPSWKDEGGYLSFDLHPAPGTGLEPVTAFAGGYRMRNLDTPLHTEPGIYLVWGVPLIGVRQEVEVPEYGTCSLSVARRMDDAFLADLAGGRGVVLCDSRGYPLSIAGGDHAPEPEIRRHAVRPAVLAERERIRLEVVRSGQPVVRHDAVGDVAWIGAYEVLTVQETPRLLLGVLAEDREATLPLPMGRVPVRAFFLAAVGLLLLMSVYLSFVITTRISRPIELLERGARALSRGELDVHVASEEGGQIGRLTRTFNRMATDLRGRIHDLRLLNHGIQDLTSRLELSEALKSTVDFFARHSPADSVRIVMVDPHDDQAIVFGGGTGSLDQSAPDIAVVLSASGPMSLILDRDSGTGLARLFAEHRSLVALPLVIAGRNLGAILLLFESARPSPINLDLLWTMAAQTSAAIENARLYQHATEDFHTGALRPEFFASRVAREVGRAQADGRALCLLGLHLVDGPEIASTLGTAKFGRFLRQLVADVRACVGRAALVCRASDDLRILLAGTGRAAGEARLRELTERLERRGSMLPSALKGLRLASGIAVYPDDGASAEFLFDALASELAHGPDGARRGGEYPLRDDGGMFLDSPAMEGVVRTLEKVAPTDLTVLLVGETGTGKEILTDLIHRWSKRASGPLVKVHCAALSESLLQSELFGHEKGAFTGAIERRIGRFEQAHGGTIFLDEIGEISHDLQVKLLRVLQEHEIDRVGGTQPIAVDVRVLAATNRDIEAMVREGRFREDLYYRLQGMLIRIPPLRERRQEIPGLVEHFRAQAVAEGHTQVRGIATDAMDELFRHDWPGNIRELRNTVLRGMILSRGPLVTRADLLGITAGAASAGGRRVRSTPAAARRSEPWPGEPEPAVEIPRPAPARRAPPSLRGRLGRLYALIAARGTLSSAEYGEAVGISQRTALRDLAALQDLGWIERIGKRRGAHYRLAESRSGTTDPKESASDSATPSEDPPSSVPPEKN